MRNDVHGCHRCGGTPAFQWTRLATDEEATSQRAEIAVLQDRPLSDEEIVLKYGPLRIAVYGCAEHDLGDINLRTLVHAARCQGHGSCACDSDTAR
jgi:hypothetical protein